MIERIGLLLARASTPRRGPAGSRRRGSWPRTPTGASSRRRTWRRPSGSTWASPRAGELEGQFRAISTRRPRGRRGEDARLARWPTCSRELLLTLVPAADDLNRKGVTDRTHVAATRPRRRRRRRPCRRPRGASERRLAQGVRRRRRRWPTPGEADEAASAMTAAYFDEFEPLERFVAARTAAGRPPAGGPVQRHPRRGRRGPEGRAAGRASSPRSAARSRPRSAGARRGRPGRSGRPSPPRWSRSSARGSRSSSC